MELLGRLVAPGPGPFGNFDTEIVLFVVYPSRTCLTFAPCAVYLSLAFTSDAASVNSRYSISSHLRRMPEACISGLPSSSVSISPV